MHCLYCKSFLTFSKGLRIINSVGELIFAIATEIYQQFFRGLHYLKGSGSHINTGVSKYLPPHYLLLNIHSPTYLYIGFQIGLLCLGDTI